MKKRALFFTAVFSGILLSTMFYIEARVATNLIHSIFIAILTILIFLFPFVQWQMKDPSLHSLKTKLQRAIFFAMGYTSALLTFTLFRDFCIILTYASYGQNTASSLSESTQGSLVFFLALLFSLVGTWQSYYGIRSRQIPLNFKDLPPELENIKIVQISDLHIGPTLGKKFVESVVRKIHEIQPDFIVMTGDIGDGDVDKHQKDIAPLGILANSYKTYYVPGNHEYYWQASQWFKEFEKQGFLVLLNRGTWHDPKTQKLWIGGITDPTASLMGEAGPNLTESLLGSGEIAFKLLLSHRPDYFYEAEAQGYHLQLSGHTHGGQFFPWTLIAKLFHKHLLGLANKNHSWLYISPGTGTWGPPLRVGTRPEISVLTLKNSKESERKSLSS